MASVWSQLPLVLPQMIGLGLGRKNKTNDRPPPRPRSRPTLWWPKTFHQLLRLSLTGFLTWISAQLARSSRAICFSRSCLMMRANHHFPISDLSVCFYQFVTNAILSICCGSWMLLIDSSEFQICPLASHTLWEGKGRQAKGHEGGARLQCLSLLGRLCPASDLHHSRSLRYDPAGPPLRPYPGTRQRTTVSDLRLYCILCSFALGIPIRLSCGETDKYGGQDVTTIQ